MVISSQAGSAAQSGLAGHQQAQSGAHLSLSTAAPASQPAGGSQLSSTISSSTILASPSPSPGGSSLSPFATTIAHQLVTSGNPTQHAPASTILPQISSSTQSSLLTTITSGTSSAISILSSSTNPSSQDGNRQHHHHNQSPVTIYSAPARSFRPDRLATIDLIIVVMYICLLLSTSISVSSQLACNQSHKRPAKSVVT